MFNIIGLSHLVFTVNNKEFKESNYLKDRFSNPENFIFDHYQFKKFLLRNPHNKFSKITLYKSSLKINFFDTRADKRFIYSYILATDLLK